jgi:hypothetical protein
MSVTRKIRDPLYTTFQKIFTIIRIFLKSEAPKALYSSHSFIVSAGPSEDKLFGLNQQVDRTATMNPVLICLLVMVTFFFLLCDAARTGLAQGRAISPSP